MGTKEINTSKIVDLWEKGEDRPQVEKGLALLSAACPECPEDVLSRFSIGKRDAHLLKLRERLFGPRIASITDCPQCGEHLEVELGTSDLRLRSSGRDEEVKNDETLSLSHDGYEVFFRLPNSLDLRKAVDGESCDVDQARNRILERCILRAHHRGKEVTLVNLPEATLKAICELMEEADQQADIQLAMSCPFCGHSWRAGFDIVSFLWAEIGSWSGRLLREVHVLASHYGWREADILALTPRRRQKYLELIYE